MAHPSRRGFIGMTAGAATLLHYPELALAQATCVTGLLPAFMPTQLSVDCASRRNYANFKKNSVYMGLAGAVSMTTVMGKYGTYTAGNLFLFPWLKPKGQALGAAKDWQAVMPTSSTKFITAKPIPNWTMPLDEYFLRYILQAPYTSFIGFRVDVPVDINASRRAWYTNVAALSVAVGWTSDNLNAPWFGGSQWIPPTDACGGNTWRQLIADGLRTASTAIC
jgi:hypothetical protein